MMEFDNTNPDLEDEYETPKNIYLELCQKHGLIPKLDVSADQKNTKCENFFSKKDNGIIKNWDKDVWCNPPHSKTELFVRKAFNEWQKNNINIMMLIPTNTMSSRFWHQCIEGHANYYAIKGRIRFLKNGKPAKYASRNAYVCVIWRKVLIDTLPNRSF